MGMAREAAIVAEVIALRRSRLSDAAEAPRRKGRAVVLVHGFGVPAATLAPLARWLRAGGWDVSTPPLGLNVGCGEEAADAVAGTVHAAAARTGAPVALVGHSRGGLLARVVAVREPDAVERLVTISTPWVVGPPDRPGVGAATAVVRFARRRGFQGLGSIECATAPCCAALRADMARTPPMPWTALWSSTDDLAGETSQPTGSPTTVVDLRTTHLGAVLSVPGWQEIRTALTRT